MTKKLGIALFLCFLAGLAGAQEVSKKQDLSLFGLSVFRDGLERGVVQGVDAKISQVFVNMGRFNVLGLSFRMDAINVDEFVEQIRKVKEENTAVPKEFQFGEKIFTLEEYNKLVGSFLIVIPQITNFTVESKSNETYAAAVETSFTFLRGQDLSAFRVATVSTSGSDKSRAKAIKDAVDAIPAQLEFEIRKIEEFQIKSGIIEVRPNGEVFIELGKNMGIQVGDEYSLQSRSTAGGFEMIDEVGLLQIKNVQKEFSIARVVYGDASIGSPVQEIARFGVDLEGFAMGGALLGSAFGSSTRRTDITLTGGLKGSWSRGVYDIKPTASVDYTAFNLGFLSFFILPINAFVGADYYLYWGRMDLRVGAAVGATAIYNPLKNNNEDEVTYSHYGGQVTGGLNLLVTRDFKIGTSAGARVMIGKNVFWGDYIYAFAGVNGIYKY